MAKKLKFKEIVKKVRSESKKSKEIPESIRSIEKRTQEKAEYTINHVWNDTKETGQPIRTDLANEVILTVGDGDLSFSSALVRSDDSVCDKLLCTTFDSRECLLQKYGERASRNIDFLESKGVQILYELDATKLHLSRVYGRIAKIVSCRNVGRIFFNFPHTGAGIKDRDRNIRAQQELIKNFLQSSRNFILLMKNSQKARHAKYVSRSSIQRNKNGPSAEELTAIRKNKQNDLLSDESDMEFEGGKLHLLIPEIHLTVRTGDPYDDWNVKRVGSMIPDLVCSETYRFEADKFPGYQHAKTIGDVNYFDSNGEDVDFLRKPAKTFVFKLQSRKEK